MDIDMALTNDFIEQVVKRNYPHIDFEYNFNLNAFVMMYGGMKFSISREAFNAESHSTINLFIESMYHEVMWKARWENIKCWNESKRKFYDNWKFLYRDIYVQPAFVEERYYYET